MSDDTPTPLQYATPVPRRRNLLLWSAIILAVGAFVIGLLLALIGYQAARAARAEAAAARAAAVRSAALQPALPVPTVPSRMTVVGQSSHAVPGTNGMLRAQIDDITGGSVSIDVSFVHGTRVLPLTSMCAGDVNRFSIGTATLEIELVEVGNDLVRGDFAVFELRRLRAPASKKLSVSSTTRALEEED